MMRGANFLLLGVSAAVAGCATSPGVEVRAIADPAAKLRYGGGLLAEGRAQLALGNAGLALETFRKLQREQPGADAFAGIAACYAVMGRYDIARANYEYALAYAPNDSSLLTALASSLDRLGEAAQASEIRAEVAGMSAPPAALARTDAQAATPMAVPRASSVTVKLPPAEASPSAPPVPAPVEIAKAIFTRDSVGVAGSSPIAVQQAALNANVGLPALHEEAVAPPAPEPKPQPTPVEIAKAVFTRDPVVAAAAVPIGAKELAFNSGNDLPMLRDEGAPKPQPPAPKQQAMPAERPREVEFAQAEVRPFGGPYLTRSSPGVVSLITTASPKWVAPESTRRAEARATPVRTELKLSQARMASVEGPRWVPLKYSPTRSNIQILNAARVQSLAARNRTVLLDRGWRKIAIGDARKVRQRSLVLYAPAREAIARRLAAHFHCRAVRAQAVQSVVVLLGRDAATRTTSRA